MLPHGEWQNWLADNFQLSYRSAKNFMDCAERFGNLQTSATLNCSQMVELLALPASETKKFIEEKAVEGTPVEDMTIKTLRENLDKDNTNAIIKNGVIELYKIKLYEDRNGKKPVAEYLKKLSAKKDKDSRIKLNKIRDYIKLLSKFGLMLGEPYVKHIGGELYELRPIKDRILFAEFTGEEFILLSHFVKKTQKTPTREIEKAQKRLKESREKNG